MKAYINLSILISILFLFSCNSKTKESRQKNIRTELLPEPDKQTKDSYGNHKEFFQMSNDSLWNYLVFQKGGCLTGGQQVNDRKFGGEECIMSNSTEWKIFFSRNKDQITNFLINKISSDTTKTHIHTCPFFTATEGEVAVYGLQKIYLINWYDFDKFIEFKNRKSKNSLENHQAWLQQILKDKLKRELLISCWEKEAVNKK